MIRNPDIVNKEKETKHTDENFPRFMIFFAPEHVGKVSRRFESFQTRSSPVLELFPEIPCESKCKDQYG